MAFSISAAGIDIVKCLIVISEFKVQCRDTVLILCHLLTTPGYEARNSSSLIPRMPDHTWVRGLVQV